MKKTLLLFLFGALGTFCSTNTFAQTFSFEKDTVRGSVPYDLKNHIINNSSTPIKVSWRITSNNFPASWLADPFGICDNVTCYNYTQPSQLPATHVTDSIYSGASNAMEFKLQMNPPSAPAGGPYYMTVEATVGTETKSMTFITTKFPTGINSVNKSSDITVYPNPAHDELNVLFDGNAGVKNIAVYNLIGKVVSVYRVSGNSAKLEIGNIPSGIYIVRLVDNSGNVVATRKFTRQ